MISKKILYSEQLLQLVLALSLLQVDPINYLEWGVMTRIHSNDGSPWQLEVAHTPFTDYPYMNRKTYVPLIEDLARYDRIRSHNVQAYLLNLPEDNTSPFIASMNNNNNSSNINNNNNTGNATSIAVTADSNNHHHHHHNLHEDTATLVNLIQDRFQEQGNAEDIFLQSDSFNSNTESIVDQNLADLNDYEEPHFLATKNEPERDPWDNFIGISENGDSDARSLLNLNGTRPPTTYTRSAIIDLADFLPFVNDSNANDDKRDVELDDDSNSRNSSRIVELVKEEKENDSDVGDQDNNNSNSESTISSNVELTVEVSVGEITILVEFCFPFFILNATLFKYGSFERSILEKIILFFID
jgi:hypothetical protein